MMKKNGALQKLFQWVYSVKKFHSEKNGEILCERKWGRWKVSAGGYGQTSPRVDHLWETAFTHIPQEAKIKKICIIGTGAGGSARIAEEKFPSSPKVVVEHDPAMIEIGKTLGIFPSAGNTRVVIDDAANFLGNSREVFDCILVDIFTGSHFSPHVSGVVFWELIARRLSRHGFCLINAFMTPEIFDAVGVYLSQWDLWKDGYNTFALYRGKGCGKIGDPVPDGYTHYLQMKKYLLSEPVEGFPVTAVGEPGCLGIRYHTGPLWFESYTGDEEPTALPGPARFIMWQPISRMDVPHGWHRSPMYFAIIRKIGFSRVGENYWEEWSPHAKRDRGMWLKNKTHEIVEISFHEFVVSYPKNFHYRVIKKDALPRLKRRVDFYGTQIKFFAACDMTTGEIHAAAALLDARDYHKVVYLSAYVVPTHERELLSLGLVDKCFAYCLANEIPFLDFGGFLAPGNPRSWRGFSKFKSKFNPYFLCYPKPMVRFVRKSEIR